MPKLRSSEWLIVAFLTYTAVLAQLLGLRPPIPLVTAGVNLVVIAGFFLLAWADSLRGRLLLGAVRDWYPVPLMILGYRQMGWFTQPKQNTLLEQAWVVWDRMLLNEWGLKAAIESLGPVLPSLLEVSYSIVYTTAPFGLAMLYVYGRRRRVNAFTTTFLIGILSAYALFPYFPSEPPWTVFPGQDFPTYDTPFRRFNAGLLKGYGIHTSVFPSAHVAGAFAAAFGMILFLPERPWVGRLLFALASLIATATVYGRYHYAVDALAGFALSVVALVVAASMFPRRS